VGGPFYQVLLAGAAMRAVWREQHGRTDWELTSHVGAHLTSAAPGPAAGTAAGPASVAGPASDPAVIREDVPA